MDHTFIFEAIAIITVLGVCGLLFVGKKILDAQSPEQLQKIDSLFSFTEFATDQLHNITEKLDKDPGSNSPIDVLNKIAGFVNNGVRAAEQLYKASKLDKSERKEYAIKYARKACEFVGIPWSDTIESHAETILQAIVGTLPKTHPPTITIDDIKNIAKQRPDVLIQALQEVQALQQSPAQPAPQEAPKKPDLKEVKKPAADAEPDSAKPETKADKK